MAQDDDEIAILEAIQIWANKTISVSNTRNYLTVCQKTICARLQHLEQFNCVQTNEPWLI